MRIPIALTAVICLLVTFVLAEDARDFEWSGANTRTASFDELAKAYLALPDPPPVGGVYRDTYFLWSLTNLLCDSLAPDLAAHAPPCITLPEFREKYCKGLDAMTAALAQTNKNIPGVADIVLAAAFLMHSKSSAKERDPRPAVANAAQVIDYYTTGEGKEALHKPLFRQALSLLANEYSGGCYTHCTQEMGGRGLFLLAILSGNPIAERKTGTREWIESTAIPIPGLAIYQEDRPARFEIDSPLHPLVKLPDRKFGAYFVFRGPNSTYYITTWGGGFGAGTWHYFESFVFQRGFYGSTPVRNPSEENPLNGFRHDISNKIVADIRAMRIAGEFTTSTDIRKLCDPFDKCYSRIMEMAVVNDHPEFATGLEVLDALAKYSPREIRKYNEYLRESEAFLVADYERTVITTVEGHNFVTGASSKTPYISPDFTTAPKIWVVYIPRVWLRYGAVYGLESLLFDMNLLGIGDRENLIKGDGEK